jgi:hypothetical protein
LITFDNKFEPLGTWKLMVFVTGKLFKTAIVGTLDFFCILCIQSNTEPALKAGLPTAIIALS